MASKADLRKLLNDLIEHEDKDANLDAVFVLLTSDENGEADHEVLATFNEPYLIEATLRYAADCEKRVVKLRLDGR